MSLEHPKEEGFTRKLIDESEYKGEHEDHREERMINAIMNQGGRPILDTPTYLRSHFPKYY